jgi:hypothetical protein
MLRMSDQMLRMNCQSISQVDQKEDEQFFAMIPVKGGKTVFSLLEY